MVKRPKVLLVDDLDENLVATRSLLSKLDCDIVCCNSGNDALKATLNHDFALIILDVRMPDMDGYETAGFIRMEPRSCDVPIIFLSANQADEFQVFKGYESGGVDFITKPFVREVFLSKIRVFLELDRRKARLAEQNANLEMLLKEKEEVNGIIAVQKRFLETVLDSMSHPFFVIDTRTRDVVLANAAVRMDPWSSILTCKALARRNQFPCGEGGFPCPMDEVLLTGLPAVAEHETALPDGRARFLEIHAYPVRDDKGDVAQVIEYILDVTEHKQAEEQLKKAKRVAEQAAAAKSEFLANVSHEIRTPMTAVLGFARLLLDTTLSEKQRQFVHIIASRGEDLLCLINEILDLSKIEAGRLDLAIGDVNLKNLLGEMVETMAIQSRKRDVKLALAMSPELPATVVGDALRLRQVLLNLLTNAMKFTERGSVKLEARPWAAPADGGLLDGAAPPEPAPGTIAIHFSVADTGIGIPEEKQEMIFDPFSQADGSVTRRYGGTGLGLAISRRLVEKMGGEIWVESLEGRGSVFHFTAEFGLPEAHRAGLAPSVGGGGPDQPAHGGGDPSPPGLTVAVAEDEAINRLLIAHYLKDMGHFVLEAENGVKLLQQMRGHRVDIVVMDVMMPEMDGIEAARAIREMEKESGAHVPILAVTACAMSGDMEACMAAGMDSYLSKPVDKESLRREVDFLSRIWRTRPPPPEQMP